MSPDDFVLVLLCTHSLRELTAYSTGTAFKHVQRTVREYVSCVMYQCFDVDVLEKDCTKTRYSTHEKETIIVICV